MGRPPKPINEKRVQLNIRLNPADRDRLSQLAASAGKPVATYAESVLVAHLDRIESTTPETRSLIALAEQKIGEMETQTKGRWHKNLKAWAAVAQMLSHILENDRPERPNDDEVVNEAFSQQVDAVRQRQAIVEKLADLGFAVNADPNPKKMLGVESYGGLFGASPRRGSSRTWERASIDAIEDNELRAKAKVLFAELEEADGLVAQAEERFRVSLQPYIEAEQEGRQIGRAAFPSQLNALLSAAPRIVKWPFASKT